MNDKRNKMMVEGQTYIAMLKPSSHGHKTEDAMITDSFKRLASEVFLFIPDTPSHKLHGQKKSPHTLCVLEYTLKDKPVDIHRCMA